MDLDNLLQQVIAEAKAIGIPVSQNIRPKVIINSRAKTRFGCCRKTAEGFVIEISDRVIAAGEQACRKVLSHEILHSCYGCMSHGVKWKSYAAKMNAAYGYEISRAKKGEQLGVETAYTPKYRLRCQSCGAVFERMRKSAIIKNYKRYRCRCGGKLELLDKE